MSKICLEFHFLFQISIMEDRQWNRNFFFPLNWVEQRWIFLFHVWTIARIWLLFVKLWLCQSKMKLTHLITPTLPSLRESWRTFSLASCLSAFETDIRRSDITFILCSRENKRAVKANQQNSTAPHIQSKHTPCYISEKQISYKINNSPT